MLQVKQSQEHLLERLISYVHNLEPTQLEHLLEEDQEVTQKRAAAQMSLQVGPGCGRGCLASRLCGWGLDWHGCIELLPSDWCCLAHAASSIGRTGGSVSWQLTACAAPLWCRTCRRPSGS